jgi:hypothetical protein
MSSGSLAGLGAIWVVMSQEKLHWEDRRQDLIRFNKYGGGNYKLGKGILLMELLLVLI